MEQINRRDFIKIVTLSGLTLSSNSSNIYGLEKVIDQTKEKDLKQKQQIKTSELLKIIKIEESASFVQACRKNTPFKEQIKKHGLEETIRHVAKLKSYSIDIAEKYLHEANKQIPQEDYVKASEQVGKDELNFYKGHTKPADKKVVKARAETIQLATKNARRILLNSNKIYENKDIQTKYHTLIKRTFTRKEYAEYCKEMANAMDIYYDSLADSLGWKKAFGKKHIQKAKDESRKGYFLTLEKVYGKENPNQ